MAVTLYPRFTAFVDATPVESGGGGSAPWLYTWSAGGGMGGGSVKLSASDDWCVDYVINGDNVFFGLSNATAAVNDFSLVPYYCLYALGDNVVSPREFSNVRTANGFYNGATLSNGDIIRYQKVGMQLRVMIYESSVGIFRTMHVYDAPVTFDLYPWFYQFTGAGQVLGVTVTYGQIQDRFPDNQVNIVEAGNSISVRTDLYGGTPIDYAMQQAPIFGSRARYTNVGVDGQDTVTMGSGTSRAAVAAAYDPSKLYNVLFINEITNAVWNTPESGAAAMVEMQTAIANFLTDNPGWIIILVGTIARQGAVADGPTLTDANTRLLDANAIGASWPASYSTYHVKVYIDPRVGPMAVAYPYFDADFALTAGPYYYDASPNRLHLSQIGIELHGNYRATGIRSAGIPIIPVSPSILVAPASTWAFEGDNISFSVTAIASDNGTVTYQWYKNGVAITGQTSSTATFPVYAADFGASITCALTDANGTGFTKPAQIYVRSRRFRQRKKVPTTYDFSGPGWFSFQMSGGGLFDRDMAAPTGGPNVYNLSASDAATAADSSVALGAFAVVGTDTVSAVDAATNVGVFAASGSDAASASDASTALAVYARSATDAVTAADTAASAAAVASSATDSVTASDTSTSAAAVASSATDSVTASDASTTQEVVGANASDNVTAADTSTTQEVVGASATDSVTAADASTQQATVNATAADNVTASDASTSAAAVASTASDSVTAADTAGSVAAVASSATDAVTVSDSAVAQATLLAAATDAATAADVSTSTGTFSAAAADAITAADTSVSTSGSTLVASDSVTAADASTSTGAFAATATDPVTAADSANRAYVQAAPATDAVTASDSSTSTGAFGAVASDAVTATDLASTGALPTNLTASDAVTASDASTTQEVIGASATDAVTAADSSSTKWTVSAAATDPVTAADSATLGTTPTNLSATDAVTASDSANRAYVQQASASDSVTATDAATTTAVFQVSSNDALGLSDLVTVTGVFTAGATDLASLGDVALTNAVQAIVAADGVTLGDTAVLEEQNQDTSEVRTYTVTVKDKTYTVKTYNRTFSARTYNRTFSARTYNRE